MNYGIHQVVNDFSLVSLHIDVHGLFNAKAILVEECVILFNGRRERGVILSPKDISPKVNVKALLEFKLTHYDVIPQHVSHYAKRDSPQW